MRILRDKDIEKLIRTSAFSNPAHKERLHARLPEPTVSLSPDELDAAAGGVTLPDPDGWDAWPDPGNPGPGRDGA